LLHTTNERIDIRRKLVGSDESKFAKCRSKQGHVDVAKSDGSSTISSTTKSCSGQRLLDPDLMVSGLAYWACFDLEYQKVQHYREEEDQKMNHV
jgi:hypothetical protein